MCLRRMDRTSALIDQNLNKRSCLPVNALLDKRRADSQNTDGLLQDPTKPTFAFECMRIHTRAGLGNIGTTLLGTTKKLANLIYGEPIPCSADSCSLIASLAALVNYGFRDDGAGGFPNWPHQDLSPWDRTVQKHGDTREIGSWLNWPWQLPFPMIYPSWSGLVKAVY